MATEMPRRRKLSELVTDHILRHKNGHVPTPVMDTNRVTDHLGKDGRVARPGLQYTLFVIASKQLDPRKQPRINERTLLD